MHERRTDPGLGRLIEQLTPYAESLPPDSDDAALVRVTARDFAKAIRVPTGFVERLSAHSSAAYDAWTRARPNNDFASHASRSWRKHSISAANTPEFFAPYQHVIDPMIDDMDEGMTCASVRSLLAELRAVASCRWCVPSAIGPQADDSCLHGVLCRRSAARFRARHRDRLRVRPRARPARPLPASLLQAAWAGDVRITTRLRRVTCRRAVLGTIHETGHGLYEQGFDPELDGTPLGGAFPRHPREPVAAVGEPGRPHRRFWPHFFPRCQRLPGRLRSVPLEGVLPAVNSSAVAHPHRGRRGHLQPAHHPALRAGAGLLGRRLAVKDLPAAWRAASSLLRPHAARRPRRVPAGRALVGRRIGYFPTYTLGNVLSAQFYAAALRAHPEIPQEIGEGRFATLKGWL